MVNVFMYVPVHVVPNKALELYKMSNQSDSFHFDLNEYSISFTWKRAKLLHFDSKLIVPDSKLITSVTESREFSKSTKFS